MMAEPAPVSVSEDPVPRGRTAITGDRLEPISVGFLCSEYPTLQPRHGGIGSFVQTLAHALVDRGHRATVYGFGDQDAESMDAGVLVISVRRRGLMGSIRAMQARIKRDLATGAIEIAESAESEAHCLPRHRGTVVRFHGSHHFWCATLPQKKRYSRLLLEQIAIRRAANLCAVSQYAADVTRRSMHLGQRAIEILGNPVDTTVFAPNGASVVPNRILFAGSITEKKGVRELCASMDAVRRAFPSAQLQLVGRDVVRADGSSLRKSIEQGLTPAAKEGIRFLGALPRPEVSRLMAAATVCVFPSHMETQGIVILEAMACGRPVLAPRRGPGPEVLGPDGECGFLVDPTSPDDIAEKICRVLGDPALAARMGECGRRRAVADFSLPVCVNQNLDFFRRQLGQS
jgi:glycosyltransferase involved in cell wall biosynthesis